ncbi:MAG: symmetrical bis(5'-nucleosyl)-tetraphosphatase [Proteobacteria bacterium]|nr:symmetrical bis(5'-nucleosyl)-tetraphosphatase [Pseudomonadota bacterium]
MTRYAVGDVQGCERELHALLKKIGFRSDRDRLWCVGDLVNRGPASLEVLRFVRSLGDNAVVVLGNHDLHLLAIAHGAHRLKKSDTLAEILAAPDRERLLGWLQGQPLVHVEGTDLMVHAGLVPQWDAAQALALSREVQQALARDARGLFEHMYGNEPERWSDGLRGHDRLRFIINACTRLRVCTAAGEVDFELKGEPPPPPSPLKPWFEHDGRWRASRVVFGHWSALGLVLGKKVVGLDTGCVWGGKLTALDLDGTDAPAAVRCAGYRTIGAD